jgi:hypothetical protein
MAESKAKDKPGEGAPTVQVDENVTPESVQAENAEHLAERDPMDNGAGVLESPIAVNEGTPGPEDAYDPDSKGDYSDRIDSGPHMVVVPTGLTGPDEPKTKLVEAGSPEAAEAYRAEAEAGRR